MRRDNQLDTEAALNSVFTDIAKAFLFFYVVFWFLPELMPMVYEGLSIKPCTQSRVVKKVGGCNIWGACGVLLDDGSIAEVSKPAPDQLICTKREWFANDSQRIRIPASVRPE